MEKKKGGQVKKWLLAIAIAIVLAMFVSYGIRTFFPEPLYEDYCNSTQKQTLNLSNEELCLEIGGQWVDREYVEYVDSPKVAKPIMGYCDPDFTCRKDYEKASNAQQDKAFMITVISGLIFLIAGIVLKVESVSLGLLLGGILNLFVGTVSYWGRFQNAIKFIILGIILVILIWIGYKKLK